jgi:hypothetical protein
MGVGAICKQCKAERRKPGITAEREIRRQQTTAGLKRCGLCKCWKPFVEFHKRAASNDGLTYRCISCVNEVSRQWKLANPGAFQAWYAENKEWRAAYWLEWYENNKEHRAASYKAWAKANSGIVNALVAKRNAAKKHATVPWADLAAIERFYVEADRLTRATGIKHEVDHIYPIQGRNVCGLHVETNLQILTKTANIRKGNRE